MDYYRQSLDLHKKLQGKLEVRSLSEVKTIEDLSVIYTPGVAGVCSAIAQERSLAKTHTIKGRTIAVVSDGSAVLGLGNIGPEAAMPVMEGKAVLFKEMGGVDAFPICLDTQDTEQIIAIVKALAPTFGGINLEDIAAPRCFEIEARLKKELDIPVFHDDQWGTAIVVLAGLINALQCVDKSHENARVVVNGAGAAGIAVTTLLLHFGFKNIILCDSKGTIHKERTDLNEKKKEIAHKTNHDGLQGTLTEALRNADIFLGLSKGGLLSRDDIALMNEGAIVFAMANPTPEIMPDEARAGGAKVIATGRSDFPNQVNNALVFPGLFKGALRHSIDQIEHVHMIKAATQLAGLIVQPTADQILPAVLDPRVADAVAQAFE